MTTIRDLIEHYSELVAILRQERIQRAILFKGFTPLERNNVNLYLEYADDDPKISSTREVNISRSLERPPFGFEVCITDRGGMNPAYLAKLDASNSVELSQEPKKFEMTQSQLISVFGENWEFNEMLKLATRTGMEGFEEHASEMEAMRAWFEEGEDTVSCGDKPPPHMHTGRMFEVDLSRQGTTSPMLNITATLDGRVLINLMLSLSQIDPETLKSSGIQEALKDAIVRVLSSDSHTAVPFS